MQEQVIPPRLYQGPRQEKQYRKLQRQLQQEELQVVSLDKQQSTALAVIPVEVPKPDTRIVVSVSKNRSIPLIVLAYGFGLVGLGINAWYAYTRGTTVVDRLLLLSIGLIAEPTVFFLPPQMSRLLKGQRYGAFLAALFVYLLCLVFAVTNSLGFASLNLTETATARAERITPAVADAQRRLDAITASKTDECKKRGDKCRQLEKDEQSALESLEKARHEVSETSDPQTASAAKLVTWVSSFVVCHRVPHTLHAKCGFHPTADDFAMLRLLLLTLLPQLGGLVLMVASRS